MTSLTVLLPTRVTAHGFKTLHRAELHLIYHHYAASRSDPLHSVSTEDIPALLRPLFATSFLIDDFLADNQFFGA